MLAIMNQTKMTQDLILQSDHKVSTRTSDGKKRKVANTGNGILQQKLLINRTLPIIPTTIDHLIPDRVETRGDNPQALTTPTTKGVITYAVCSSAYILWTLGNVSRTGRDVTAPCNRDVVISSPQDNGTVMIVGTTIPPACGIMGSLDIINKHGSTGSVEIGDTQKFDTSVDGNLAEGGDSMTIFSKLIG